MTQQQHDKHGSVHHAMDRLQDLFGGLFGRATAAGTTSADGFVKNATIGDMYEIRAANMALLRASSAEVKKLAETVISDHTTSTHHLEAALEMNETKGVQRPPTEVDERRRKMLENLDAAPSDKFDEMYLDQQVLAHQETLTLMSTYFRDGDNAQLRSCAAGTAPVVARHLHHAKALRSKLPS